MQQIKRGSGTGTGAAINVELGFVPDHVMFLNIEAADMVQLDHYRGMADASAVKTVTGTVARTKITSNGITLNDGDDDSPAGFTIGADTDANVSGEDYVWIAVREAQ